MDRADCRLVAPRGPRDRVNGGVFFDPSARCCVKSKRWRDALAARACGTGAAWRAGSMHFGGTRSYVMRTGLPEGEGLLGWNGIDVNGSNESGTNIKRIRGIFVVLRANACCALQGVARKTANRRSLNGKKQTEAKPRDVFPFNYRSARAFGKSREGGMCAIHGTP